MSTKPTDILHAVRELAQTDAQRLRETCLTYARRALTAWSACCKLPVELDEAKCAEASAEEKLLFDAINQLADLADRAEAESQRDGREAIGETQEYILRQQFEKWSRDNKHTMPGELGQTTYSRDRWESYKAGAEWVYRCWGQQGNETDALLKRLGINASDYRTEFGFLNVGNVVEAIAHPQREGQQGRGRDLSKCPGCGGPADNGHDRCVPPNPYYCSKCDTPPEPPK